ACWLVSVWCVLDRRELLTALSDVGGVIPGVEERVLVETDVDERRLHSGQDVRHHTFIDAPDDGTAAMPLEIELGEEMTFLDRHARLQEVGVDHDALAHGSTPPARPVATSHRRPMASLELPHPPGDAKPQGHHCT